MLILSLLGIPAAIWFGNLATRAEGTELTFLAVGQGDCVLIRSRGLNAIVDAGPKTEWFDAGETIVGPKLRHRGVTRIDIAFLTHPDSDHIGGLPSVAERFRVGAVAIPDHFRAHAGLKEVLQRAGVDESRCIWLRDGSRVTLGDATFIVRFAALGEDDNSGSLMLKLTAPGRSTAVLSGDAGEEQEVSLAGRGDWSAQVLKAGHHGSATSTCESWLREVKPKFLVISCGRDNQFGHPAASVLERAAAVGAVSLRTDRDGDITFVASANGFKLLTGR